MRSPHRLPSIPARIRTSALTFALLGAGISGPQAESVEDLFGLEEEAPVSSAETPDSDDAAATATKAPAPATAADAEAEPGTVDDLFGIDEAPAADAPDGETEPGTVDDLFGIDEVPAAPEPGTVEAPAALASTRPLHPADAPREYPPVFGFLQSEFAYTYAGAGHVQQWRQVIELGSKGSYGPHISWFTSIRANVDPTYAANDRFPDSVARDQGAELMARDMYLDFSRGGIDFRFGRQQIIWGEMVGLFFADVVSARDLRQFVLPDFDMLRMPQWAIRAERYGEWAGGDIHAEFIFIPFMTYDDIGVVGAEYFPFRPVAGPGQRIDIREDRRPENELEQAGYGARLNYLKNGWDAATFFYTAASLSPAFGRSVTPGPLTVITFTPERNREYQLGATLAKDAFGGIFKAEAVYTANRLFENIDLRDADGLSTQNVLSWVAAMEFNIRGNTRLTVQGFQNIHTNHEVGVVPEEVENGYTLLIATRALHPDIEPEILYVSSLNRLDSMFQAKVNWDASANVRLVTGVDFFEGGPLGFFGRYDQTDRVYLEGRYSF